MSTSAGREERLVLDVEHLRKTYPTPAGPLVVLDDVSLVLKEGDTVAITGPSGSGKSTLLNILGSLDRPTSGSVRLGATDVTSLYDSELAEYRSRSVGFVFQDHHLLPQLTAFENVCLPTIATPSGVDAECARELLRRVGLEDRLNSLPAKLSGGERQRVAIARAMINHPPLLLCDEPTGNLDRETSDRIAGLFADLASEQNVMLVIVTHNMDVARRFQRRYDLRLGLLKPAER